MLTAHPTNRTILVAKHTSAREPRQSANSSFSSDRRTAFVSLQKHRQAGLIRQPHVTSQTYEGKALRLLPVVGNRFFVIALRIPRRRLRGLAAKVAKALTSNFDRSNRLGGVKNADLLQSMVRVVRVRF